MANERSANLVFPEVEQTRIANLRHSFELQALLAREGAEGAIRSPVPGGLAIIGLDQATFAGEQFAVKAVGGFCIQGVGTRLAAGAVKGSFNRETLETAVGFGAPCRFHVLVADFAQCLRLP